jgi:hypothetical protein
MYSIYPGSSLYRPYHVGKYELNNIVFYNENGTVVLTSQRGWLTGNDQKDLPKFDMEKTPVLKRKVDFGKMFADKQTFIMKSPNEYHWDTNKYTLFIPFTETDWKTHPKSIDFPTTRDIYTVFTNKTQNFRIEKFEKTEIISENKEFVDKVKKIGDLMGPSCSGLSEYSIMKNKEQIIAAIKAFSG